MYILKTESSFDAAHFLAGYDGKCKNLHGHRWRVVVEVQSKELIEEGTFRGMCVDFAVLKKDLRELTEEFDHALVLEKNTLKEATYQAFKEEDFKVVELEFRPTAENLSRYFYEQMKKRGYAVKEVTVYETPNNAASYQEV